MDLHTKIYGNRVIYNKFSGLYTYALFTKGIKGIKEAIKMCFGSDINQGKVILKVNTPLLSSEILTLSPITLLLLLFRCVCCVSIYWDKLRREFICLCASWTHTHTHKTHFIFIFIFLTFFFSFHTFNRLSSSCLDTLMNSFTFE